MIKNCWESQSECSRETREKCAAYPKYGRLCWLVACSEREEVSSGIPARTDKGCCECSWYRGVRNDYSFLMEHYDGVLSAKNCWEFWGCGKEKTGDCTAFPDSGKFCWMASSYDKKHEAATIASKTIGEDMANCYECPWYWHRISQPFYGSDSPPTRRFDFR